MKNERNWGGSRPGSGRPKEVNARSQGVYLSDEIWSLRDQLAEITGKTKRQIMEQAILDLARKFNMIK